jgi:glutamyl-tRNA synthetase
LTDFVEQADPILTEEVVYQPEAIEKHLSSPGLAAHVSALSGALAVVEPFDEARIEASVRDVANTLGTKAGLLIHATRVAVTGRTSSPGLFEVLALLGRVRTLARLDRLHRFLVART